MRLILLLTAMASLLCPFAHASEILRPPAASGVFYPDKPEPLLQQMRAFYANVPEGPPPGKLVACIVPHSGFEFSGQVAAHAFKLLQPGQYKRVIILAPSHFAAFEGCSIPIASGFVTPLGVVPLDTKAIDELAFSPLISMRALRYEQNNRHALHESEYAIEVLLPFLQERLGLFELVPILVGSLNNASGKFDINSARAVAEALTKIIDDQTLLIASSDLTHFGNDFSFRPFEQDIPAHIEELDQTAFRLIARRDDMTFQRFLEETRVPICGRNAIQVLLNALPRHTVAKVLAYDLSSRTTGNLDRSVSYGTVVFMDPNSAPPKVEVKANPFAIPLVRIPGGVELPAAEVAPAPQASDGAVEVKEAPDAPAAKEQPAAEPARPAKKQRSKR